MTFRHFRMSLRYGTALGLSAGLLCLAACAGGPTSSKVAKAPDPVLPSEQYPLQARTHTDAINLRVNPNGLSENQRRALDQVADRASWTNGEPVSLEIVINGNPASAAAGHAISNYLMGHDVSEDDLSTTSVREQPDDIVTVRIVTYQARIYKCNRTWENLAATRDNKPYKNFGCAVNSNLAAQIADPRDIDSPAPATPSDATRKSAVLDHYRKGEKTSSEADDNAKGTVSQAIK